MHSSQVSCSGFRALPRVSVSFVTCLCLCPVQLIVVGPLSCLLLLVLASVFAWVCCWGCTFFGFRPRFPCQSPLFLLLPRKADLVALGLLPTPWMNNRTDPVTASDIRALVCALEQLTLQVSDLVSRVESLPVDLSSEPRVTDLGDWELIGEPALPPGFASPQDLSRLLLCRGPETGPPDTPGFLLDFACRELKGPSSACYRAFRAGFWSWVSSETHTPYQPAEPFGPPSKHWIVLRSRFGSKPVRVASKRDFYRAIGNTSESDLISEEFASLAELSIYCAGAGVRVPPLQQWKGNSSSSQ